MIFLKHTNLKNIFQLVLIIFKKIKDFFEEF